MSSAFGPKDLSGIIVFPQGQALRDSTREGSRNIRRDAQCSAEPMTLFPEPPRLCCYALMSFVVVAFLAGCGGSQLPIGAPGAVAQNYAINSTAAHDKTFEYTGAEQSFKVPAGVTSIEVDALGAAGAGRQKGYIGIPGHGGRVKAAIPVKPGQALRIFVGGSGSYPSRGFNGGGDGANRGGGATDVRDGDDLSDRILVAGGGGGVGPALGGGGTDGGGGGGKKGGNGHGGAFSGGIGSPGQGGTQNKGGAGGASGSKKAGAGSSGALGVGGNGGEGHSTRYVSESGSGGGGGYYGGGGGGGSGPLGNGGAGGGGSGYVEPTATDVHMWRNWARANGDGLVVLRW